MKTAAVDSEGGKRSSDDDDDEEEEGGGGGGSAAQGLSDLSNRPFILPGGAEKGVLLTLS